MRMKEDHTLDHTIFSYQSLKHHLFSILRRPALLFVSVIFIHVYAIVIQFH